MRHDLINELKASRPAAPQALRARVREISAQSPLRPGGPCGRSSDHVFRIAVPAVVTLAVVSAGVLGLARSGGIDDTFSKTGTSVETPTILPTSQEWPPRQEARRRATSRAARARPARRRSRRTPLVRSA